MSYGRAERAAPSAGSTKYKPYFGVEIEIFVRLNEDHEAVLRRKQRSNPESLPPYYKHWDFALSNGANESLVARKAVQRTNVGMALERIIELALGPNNGWACKADASLKEYKIQDAPDKEKWCTCSVYQYSLNLSPSAGNATSLTHDDE
jgi:hypothetical protein